MWAIVAIALLAALRHRLRWRPRTWRMRHVFLAVVIDAGTIVHALLIEGTMETVSKVVLCLLVFAATTKIVVDTWVRPKASRSP
jgi:hypothetical protein